MKSTYFPEGFTSKTVKRYVVWEREFKHYFEGQELKDLSYNELLVYFQDKQSKGLTRSTLVHILARIKRYYNYLNVPNPLAHFQLKGYEPPQQIHYLSGEELEQFEQWLCVSVTGKSSIRLVSLPRLGHGGIAALAGQQHGLEAGRYQRSSEQFSR